MSEKQQIHLSSYQRRKLLRLVQTGTHKARTVVAAHVLLQSARGWSDAQIAAAFNTSLKTVQRIRQRYLRGGLARALHEQPRSGRPHKLTVADETALIALACSKPPAGRCRWTVRLLAAEAQRQELLPAVAPETIRQVLKKTRPNLGNWSVGVTVISPRRSGCA